MNLIRNIFCAAIICITTSLPALSQSIYSLIPMKSSVMITGTSSIHDWEMKVDDPEANIELKFSENKVLEISSLFLSVDAKKIYSGNKIMDKKTHDALRADQHKNITFEFISVEELVSSDKVFNGTASGNLTIAGVSKVVSLSFNGKVIGEDQIEIEGHKTLKMSDFSIDSPTAMMGALKTGDEITIGFKIFWSDRV